MYHIRYGYIHVTRVYIINTDDVSEQSLVVCNGSFLKDTV